MPKTLTYLEAISEGLREEMRGDRSVFLLGEDIGTYGGAFKVTKGFIEEFGEERVIDTVLGEAAIIGAASGAAIAGMRPVAEINTTIAILSPFHLLYVFRRAAAFTAGRFIRPIPKHGSFMSRDSSSLHPQLRTTPRA